MTVKEKKFNLWLICLPVAVLLAIYVFFRAFNLSYTHDESLTYDLVLEKDIFRYTANNHVLNTWLMNSSSSLFGEKELSLRLPNVLSFLIYLFFCCKLFMESKRGSLILVAIPLLFLNPFVLDFFSLSRGYGLSLGFMIASLYFFLREKKKENISHSNFISDFILTMLFAALALMSNLSLINFYLALFGIIFIQYILFCIKNKISEIKKHLWVALLCVIACIPLFFSLQRLLILNEANGLYAGAGSFDESISSFIERSCYSEPYPVWFAETLQTFIKCIFPIGIIVTLLMKNFNDPLLKLAAVIVLILSGIYLEHYLFSALFPISRTGIYFIPLFGLFIFYFIKQLIEISKINLQRVVVALAVIFISIPLSYHFIKTLNIDHTFEWRYETHTKKMMSKLASENKDREIVLGHNWIFGPGINYYIHSRKMKVSSVKIEGVVGDQDFIYDFKDNMKDKGWKAIQLYDDIGTGFYQNPGKIK